MIYVQKSQFVISNLFVDAEGKSALLRLRENEKMWRYDSTLTKTNTKH